MKVLIYAPSAREGGGITYLQNLLSEFPRDGKISGYVIAPENLRLDLEHSCLRRVVTPSLNNLWVRATWEKFILPRLLRKLGIDVLFCPGGTVPYFDSNVRTAVTFQNMLPFDLEQRRRFPLGFVRTKWVLLRRALAKGIKQSDLVIFISKYGEEVIRKQQLRDSGNSVQIYHGVEEIFRENPIAAPTMDLPQSDFILYVSAFDYYKSHRELLRGYALARQRDNLEMPLVLMGRDRRHQRAKLEREIDRLGIQDFVIVRNEVARNELPAIYRAAGFCVYPSECENCPFIVLEMLASGCAIACSNRLPMPEIAGDAAVYFNPSDESEIASVLSQLGSDPELRAELSLRAQQRSLDFDWKTCAERTWQSIEELSLADQVGIDGLASSSETVEQTPSTTNELAHAPGWRKALRYALIYGLPRTWTKIRGRRRRPTTLARTPAGGDTSILGCGQFAYSTIGYFWRKSRGHCFLDCFDVDHSQASSFAHEYRCRVADAATDLLENPKLKYLFIASNHATHADYAIEAIRRGVPNVFIEKPIAVDRGQLAELVAAIKQGKARVFAGYNRPYARAIQTLRDRITIAQRPWNIACHVTGHEIAAEHWYRDPAEGTRICGNLGHWIDLAVHLMAWRSLPHRLEISVMSSNPQEPDDNLTINLVSDLHDLITITLTSQCEPFEGINETININHHQAIAKIDDFRSLQFRQGSKLFRKRYWPKDVGHRDSISQPLSSSIRDWNEVVLSSLLTLLIKEMICGERSTATFDVEQEMALLRGNRPRIATDEAAPDEIKGLRTR